MFSKCNKKKAYYYLANHWWFLVPQSYHQERDPVLSVSISLFSNCCPNGENRNSIQNCIKMFPNYKLHTPVFSFPFVLRCHFLFVSRKILPKLVHCMDTQIQTAFKKCFYVLKNHWQTNSLLFQHMVAAFRWRIQIQQAKEPTGQWNN